MTHSVRIGACAFVSVVLSVTSAIAQRPYQNGISTRDFAFGLTGPASLSQGPSGEFYVSNIFDVNGSGQPTPVYRVQSDGTVSSNWTAALTDPDVAVMNPAQTHLMVGQYQKITAVDISNGSQAVWLQTSTIGNVDGMAYHPSGDLLVSAIDKRRIQRVNPTTKAVTVFADLGTMPVVGFGSIAVNPADGAVFLATPLDGNLVKLDSDGNLIDSAFASGFVHMGQLAVDGDFIYVTDNVGGAIYKVDLATQAVTTFVDNVIDFGGALLPLGGGSFLASRQTTDSSDGTLYKIEPMNLGFSGPVGIGSSVTFMNQSPADANRRFFTIFSTDLGPLTLPDGRNLPLLFSNWVFFTGKLDPAGEWQLPLAIPNDASLVGLSLYGCTISLDPDWNGFFAISNALPFTVQ